MKHKVTVTNRVTDGSDYSSPIADPTSEVESTTSTGYISERVTATTGGVTVALPYTTVTSATLYNRDATNYVTVTYKSVGGGGSGGTTQTQKLLPGGAPLVLADVTASTGLTLTAHTASCVVDVFAAGT